jgi:hypothetical protein
LSKFLLNQPILAESPTAAVTPTSPASGERTCPSTVSQRMIDIYRIGQQGIIRTPSQGGDCQIMLRFLGDFDSGGTLGICTCNPWWIISGSFGRNSRSVKNG